MLGSSRSEQAGLYFLMRELSGCLFGGFVIASPFGYSTGFEIFRRLLCTGLGRSVHGHFLEKKWRTIGMILVPSEVSDEN